MVSHNNQKKIAIINDISGFGRCSVAVALPIISVMKVQCSIIPTSILSNHMGFKNYFFDDYTDRMQDYIDNWKPIGLEFDGIATGFLGSEKQIDIVEKFFEDFATDRTTIIVDPVMGDNGRAYSTYTPQMCQKMKKLVTHADILTPNMTEACILTDTPYDKGNFKVRQIAQMAEKLSQMGPDKVVITGIRQGGFIANLCFEKDKGYRVVRTHKVEMERSGTGDIFSSIISADAVNEVEFLASVRKASRFIKKCLQKSIELEIPSTDGVCFEELLRTLK